ncbi:hypothetical protein ACFVJ4_37455 [Streptomyces sp. NPDC127178]|uniref:hypothetical protein n=1 Tax=unclassified Streptomyces TaxID=2593676 RepID=UPI00363BA059
MVAPLATVTPATAAQGATSDYNAYIANYGKDNVSVVHNRDVVRTISVGVHPTGVAATPNREKVYVTNNGSNNVSVIHTEKGSVDTIDGFSNPGSVAVSPNPNVARAYVANHGTNTVSVIDTNNDKVIGDPIPCDGTIDGLAVSPDGLRVFVTITDKNNKGWVKEFDTENPTQGYTVPVGSNPKNVAFTSGGDQAYVTADGEVDVIDSFTHKVSAIIPLSHNPTGIAMDNSGHAWVTLAESQQVMGIDIPSHKVVSTQRVGDATNNIASPPPNDPDQFMLATSSKSNDARYVGPSCKAEGYCAYIEGLHDPRGVAFADPFTPAPPSQLRGDYRVVNNSNYDAQVLDFGSDGVIGGGPWRTQRKDDEILRPNQGFHDWAPSELPDGKENDAWALYGVMNGTGQAWVEVKMHVNSDGSGTADCVVTNAPVQCKVEQTPYKSFLIVISDT